MDRPNYDEIILNMRWGRVPFFNLNHKENEKVNIRRKLQQFNTFLNSFGLSFKNIDMGRNVGPANFRLNIEDNNNVINRAELCQRAKDVAHMSDRSYNKLKRMLKPIVMLSSLEKCNIYKQRLNSFWPITNNAQGAFIENPKAKIQYVCEKYLDLN